MYEHDGILRRRLLRAMGVAPAALTLSLVACDGSEAEFTGDSAPDGESLSNALPELGPAHDAPYEAPEEAPLPTPWVEILNTPNAGHASLFQVRDALPFAEVAVHARESEAGRVEVEVAPVATGFTDARGEATLYGLTPAEFGEAVELVYEVVHLERPEVPSEERVYALSGLVPFRPDLSELHPGLVPELLAVGERRLSCVPTLEYADETCTPVEDFHNWEALEIVSYALGDVLPPELSVLACQAEVTYPDSCCYFVEFWDTVNGSAADACQPPAQQGGGGGGGGGGWGWCEGRPFTLDGIPTRAEAVRGRGWSRFSWSVPVNLSTRIRARAAAAWLDVARAEHSSVASFSRFNLQLMQMGAPAALLARSTAAIGDEIRHACDAFGVASALAGREFTASALELGAVGEPSDAASALLDAIREGCINETVSAAFVREASRTAKDRSLGDMLMRVADDESRHAELSWAFARWVLERHPELRDEVAQVFASFDLGPAPAADPDRDALAALGVITADLQHEIATEIMERVIRPCASALLSVA